MQLISTLFYFLFAIACGEALAREVTLFDAAGSATAYIDTEQELSIYLWNGTPVAYLDKSSTYGFNGKHLGWLKQGVVRDREGYGIGFIEGAVSKLTKLEPLKALQRLSPLRSFQELEPLELLLRSTWSREPLDLFLLRGGK